MDEDAFLVSVMRLMLDNYASETEDILINLHQDSDISDEDVIRIADMYSGVELSNFELGEDAKDKLDG